MSGRRLTREAYYRLGELGEYEGRRVERLDGVAVDLGSQDWRQVWSTVTVHDWLREVFGSDFWVRQKAPLEFGEWSDPEPDVSVVAGERRTYTQHPTTALLVVEVANTTLDRDRGLKSHLYAAAGVPDYWVLDLMHDRLEVCRDPQPDAAEPHGWGYADRRWLTPSDAVSPLAAPGATVSVAALLS